MAIRLFMVLMTVLVFLWLMWAIGAQPIVIGLLIGFYIGALFGAALSLD